MRTKEEILKEAIETVEMFDCGQDAALRTARCIAALVMKIEELAGDNEWYVNPADWDDVVIPEQEEE